MAPMPRKAKTAMRPITASAITMIFISLLLMRCLACLTIYGCQKTEYRTLFIARRATVSDLHPCCTAISSDISTAFEGGDSKLFVVGWVLSNEGDRVFV